jgi:uncharacterized protein YdeI (YjbR/CyaY-like superfamily)
VLEPHPGPLGWVVARVPFEVETAWKKMVRLRVKVETGGEVFRTSLFADSDGGHFVLINRKMQKAAGVAVGGIIDLAVEPDRDEREVEVPAELDTIFRREKALAKWFAKLSDSARTNITRMITEPKSEDARERRAQQMAERMLLAMEGEKVLPPLLDVLFRRHPGARAGWDAMTQVQRRGHLLGIFYYQSPEAREKRAGKAIEDCLRLAETRRLRERG